MTVSHSIVIIEDDPFLARLYQTKFQSEGFDVQVSDDGERGLALVRESKPEVVLLDVSLPKLDGFGVLQALRGQAETKQLPVVMLTNSSKPDDVDRARQLGVAGYLIKAHFLPSEVVAKVRSLLPSL